MWNSCGWRLRWASCLWKNDIIGLNWSAAMRNVDTINYFFKTLCSFLHSQWINTHKHCQNSVCVGAAHLPKSKYSYFVPVKRGYTWGWDRSQARSYCLRPLWSPINSRVILTPFSSRGFWQQTRYFEAKHDWTLIDWLTKICWYVSVFAHVDERSQQHLFFF